jgi:lysine 2,3-aminomutase
MQEKITPHLREQSRTNKAIELQFYQDPVETQTSFPLIDPLCEDEHEAVKGVVHKYSNRALVKVAKYIAGNPQIDDVILSGGDPLYTPKTTIDVLEKLRVIDTIKVFRVGTRLPVHNPRSFQTPLLERTVQLMDDIAEEKPFYMLINFQHPSELTPETRDVIKKLRKTNLTLLSQTVFLNGVNNSEETLRELFQELYHAGVTPYYIYRCDYVRGVERFVCDINEEREIMTNLRSSLSGIACPTYVVDVPGHGKVPVPLNYWEGTDLSKCKDFKGNQIQL